MSSNDRCVNSLPVPDRPYYTFNLMVRGDSSILELDSYPQLLQLTRKDCLPRNSFSPVITVTHGSNSTCLLSCPYKVGYLCTNLQLAMFNGLSYDFLCLSIDRAHDKHLLHYRWRSKRSHVLTAGEDYQPAFGS